MQSSSSPVNGSQFYPGRRRGHVPQISISDDNHHVTEAIGDMYGDSDWGRVGGRAENFGGAVVEDAHDPSASYFESSSASPPESPLRNSLGTESEATRPNGHILESSNTQKPSFGNTAVGSTSPPSMARTDPPNTASQHFPLTDIDYESSPAAVAQELSNLQAIRRMSMNVDAADPDLPSFGSNLAIPSLAPGHSASEDDTSRLFWVPAHLHPELAPKEFKTFVEDRVDRIRRRSGEDNALSPDISEQRRSGGSLGRRRSMLSRSIETPLDYQDGAERLERKRSQSGRGRKDTAPDPSLQRLELLVNDPSSTVRKISLDSTRVSIESNPRDSAEEDMPILPPGGQSLKRSTRTNYRKGSLRKGERVPFSRRAAGRHSENDNEDPPGSRSNRDRPELGISRSQTEPLAILEEDLSSRYPVETFPETDKRRVEELQAAEHLPRNEDQFSSGNNLTLSQIATASGGRTSTTLSSTQNPHIVPTIKEISAEPVESDQGVAPLIHPERTSSHEFSRMGSMPSNTTPSRLSSGSNYGRQKSNNQTLDDMANNPSPMPGTSTRTDALSFIPTFAETKKPDKKSKDRSSDSTSRKTSWGWLLGSDDRDKDKKERDKEDRETSKKSKGKHGKHVDKTHDTTRLDVLLTASDRAGGRESLVLDRDSVKLEDDRKRESSRKSSGTDGKREGGLLSSLFGGNRKRNEKDGANKKQAVLSLSPEPPPQVLRADIDYNWTRFSILEERAIYRMAHIKLANPRRALYSQVLLSNFMYSYLAKVQQMHPSIQIPQFVTQKGQKRSEQTKQDAQSEEFSQWQRYQEQHGSDGSFDQTASKPTSASYPARQSGEASPTNFRPTSSEQEEPRNLVAANGHYIADWPHQEPYSQQGLFNDHHDSTGTSDDGDMW